MNLVVQYPDLTEVEGISYPAISVRSIKTEFAFAVVSPTQKDDGLLQMGFKHVSSMINWWPSHWKQNRVLKLYFRKFDNRQPVQTAMRHRWCNCTDNPSGPNAFNEKDLANSGCGFKIATGPLKRASFYRFFTLLRLPIEQSRLQTRWLDKNHFRLLDTGTQASFWVNGWEPETYSYKKEWAFFEGYKDYNEEYARKEGCIR